MQQFLIKRLILLAPTLCIVSVIIFSLIRLIPGDVADLMVQEYAYAPNVEALRERLGLNEPLHVQYLRWAAAAPSCSCRCRASGWPRW
jgi:peptide/nickel transport system permease protein